MTSRWPAWGSTTSSTTGGSSTTGSSTTTGTSTAGSSASMSVINYHAPRMRILVLGAGRMGYGAVHDLVNQPDVEEVTVADVAAERAHHVASSVTGNVTPRAIDVSNHEDVVALMRGHDSAISCVNYWLNERLARAAIEAGTNFCDLGGNNDVVDAELALDAEAKERGINIIPDCGLAPGMVAVLVAHALERVENAEEVHIRVGG